MSQHQLRFFYHILGAKPKATSSEIRDTFLKLSKIYHPDNPETGDQAKFIRIKHAYDKIKDAPLTNKKLLRLGTGTTGMGYVKMTGLYK